MKPKLTDWPVLKQVLRGDPHASAETASSDRTRALMPRTKTADKVARSVCPYCAVGCGQLIYVKNDRIIDIEGDPASPISEGLSLSQKAPQLSNSLPAISGFSRFSIAGLTQPNGKPFHSHKPWRWSPSA